MLPSEFSAIILLIALCATFLTAGVAEVSCFSKMSPIVVWEGERMSCSENSLLGTGGVAGAGQP